METYRASGTHLATRVLNEAQSKRYLGDVIETSPPGIDGTAGQSLVIPYTSPHLAITLRPRRRPPATVVFWTTDRESYIGVGYNKNVCQRRMSRKISTTC